MKHVPRQRGLWTPPPGVSTAVFGDSFEDLIQKSETVDMWTRCSLIILKATTVHQHPGGGAQRTKQIQVSQPDPASAAGTLGGALSLSTGAGASVQQVWCLDMSI